MVRNRWRSSICKSCTPQAGHGWATRNSNICVDHKLLRPAGLIKHVERPSWKSLDCRMCRERLSSIIDLVRLAGIEPTTLGFGGQYSIH